MCRAWTMLLLVLLIAAACGLAWPAGKDSPLLLLVPESAEALRDALDPRLQLRTLT